MRCEACEETVMELEPGTAGLQDVVGMGARRASERGDTEIALRLKKLGKESPWWMDERTLRFQMSAHGEEAPWGLSHITVRMSRETGKYVLNASVWIDDGASSSAGGGGIFGLYAGEEELSEMEGSWHTITLTGRVNTQ